MRRPGAKDFPFSHNVRAVGNAQEPYRLYAVVQPPLASATTETEPNNTPAQANMAANNYFLGALTNSADVDVYEFEAKKGLNREVVAAAKKELPTLASHLKVSRLALKAAGG